MLNYRLTLRSFNELDEELKRYVFKNTKTLYVTDYDKVEDYLEGTIEESCIVRKTTNYFPFKIPLKLVDTIEEIF